MNMLTQLIQDYRKSKEIIASICDADDTTPKAIARRKIYTIAMLGDAYIFIKSCEDMGIHRMGN